MPGNRLLHRHRTVNSSHRALERHHDAVAKALHFPTAGGGDRVPPQTEIHSSQRISSVVTQPRGQFGGSNQVRKQERQLPRGHRAAPYPAPELESLPKGMVRPGPHVDAADRRWPNGPSSLPCRTETRRPGQSAVGRAQENRPIAKPPSAPYRSRASTPPHPLRADRPASPARDRSTPSRADWPSAQNDGSLAHPAPRPLGRSTARNARSGAGAGSALHASRPSDVRAVAPRARSNFYDRIADQYPALPRHLSNRFGPSGEQSVHKPKPENFCPRACRCRVAPIRSGSGWGDAPSPRRQACDSGRWLAVRGPKRSSALRP